MTGNLIRVSNQDFDAIRANSSKLEDLIYNQNNFNADWYLDLDKTWEAIHYLLTGKSIAETEMDEAPRKIIDNTIFSDQIVDENQNLGYGPAFYNDSERVKIISQELNKLNIEELESNYDGARLNDDNIYPQIWDEDDAKPYLFDSLKEVIRFYSNAANNGQVVIGFIN